MPGQTIDSDAWRLPGIIDSFTFDNCKSYDLEIYTLPLSEYEDYDHFVRPPGGNSLDWVERAARGADLGQGTRVSVI